MNRKNTLFLISLLGIVWLRIGALPLSNKTDRVALLALKHELVSGSPRALASWNESVEFCKWMGVKCGRRHRRVTVLRLDGLQLTGSISPAIGNLTFLQEVTLSNNDLKGNIPSEFGQLPRLKLLNLTRNRFQGHIPIELTNSSSLLVIVLSHNNLIGEIPFQFGSMSQLRVLSLGANFLVSVIPPSLGNLSSLTYLSLAFNHLWGSVPFALGSASNLRRLFLSSNNLSGLIPLSIYNLSSIEYLEMSINNLSGSFLPSLSYAFPKLEYFSMGDNNFSGAIPATISNISSLKIFDIIGNSLIGSVPETLGDLRNLQKLNIGYNRLGSGKNGDFNFLYSLANCNQMDVLELHGNKFGGELPAVVGNLSSQLYQLYIGRNQISGSIPEAISNLSGLALLDLGINSLTGSIPVSIEKLQNLQRLFLHRNNLHGKIPSSIGNLPRLFDLHLHVNNFEGNIPTSLKNCTNMQNLRLWGNNLTGSIPETFFSALKRLITVYIFSNSLSGSIPIDIGTLSNLVGLGVAENNFSGEIPMQLGSCTGLTFLSMTRNNFQGSIPLSFGSLRSLESLDLSQNNLSGTIPLELQKLSYLTTLDLSFNHFEGEVPVQGVFKNFSEFSLLGNNMLCGGVPQLHLPACSNKGRKKKEKTLSLKVIVAIILSLVVSFTLIAVLVILWWRRKSQGKPAFAFLLRDKHPRLSYKDLLQATGGFASSNLIGSGSFGSVYKGFLHQPEKIIAVKVLNLQNRGAAKSFIAECKTLGQVRHRNLLKVITSCSSMDYKGNDFKALVFEFMPNGNLSGWLHVSERNESRSLSLIQRLDIAIDVAYALDYLHYRCKPPIVHCDLKPSNVLLDDDMVANVGDFGLAKLLSATEDQTGSSMIKGTIGYVAPEYGIGGTTSPEGDMYSYGILLLEMVTARRPTDGNFYGDVSLHNHCKMALPENIWNIVDPNLLQQSDNSLNEVDKQYQIRGKMWECLVSLVRIGVSCLLESPVDRMNIKDVIVELCAAKAKLLQTGIASIINK